MTSSVQFYRGRAIRAAILGLLVAGCQTPQANDGARPAESDTRRLPTGMRLDPAGRLIDLMPLPLTMIAAPDESAIVTLSSGYFAQGVTIIDRRTGTVRQELPQTSAFVGLAFAPDGQSFWSSGGNEDVVYQYRWQQGRATLMDSVMLGAPRPPLDATNRPSGTHYPAGLALSPDGRQLYVAENLADSLAVIDVASHAVRRVAVGAYPYAVAVAPTGTVYVSLWGSDHLRVFTPGASAEQPLTSAGRIPAGRHPSAMVLNARGSRIFVTSGSTDQVTVIDTRTRRILTALHDAPPSGPREGSTPNALALAPGGDRLYVAEGDNNALAVFALDSMTADLGSATDARAVPRGGDRLLGRVPSGWYPSAVLALADSVYVANGKGLGTRANPGGPGPRSSAQRQREGPTARPDRPFPDSTYTWGQLRGSVMVLATSALTDDAMAPFSTRVAHANGWDAPAGSRQSVQRAAYPPIAHVVYIIKENRTFDQVFGDLVQADADSTLVFFGRAVSPNHHALAERFGIYDRFFVNAESSPDGHNWSMAAYTTDYLQKTVPSNYSRRGRSYDYEGTNRGAIPDDDVAEPANGYLWNLVQAKGLTFRNYGEFVIPENARGPLPAGYRGNKPFLAAHTHPTFPGYNLDIPDQQRADVWIAELQEFVRRGAFPALSIVRLPNDHTAGARLGAPSPRAFMADNDLALGRMIDALSHTPFWSSTAVFVVEDDSQNGPDHVDSHRSPFLLISPWARGGVHRRFTNTTDVLATIEELLGLGAMSQFDYFGRPLRDVWRTAPDLRPFAALQPSVSLRERNTAQNTHPADARASARLALEIEDQAEEDLFNRVLWRTIRGSTVPYPGIRRVPMQALRQAEAAR